MTGRIFALHVAPINRRRWMCCILSHCESVCAFITTPQFSCLLSSAVDGILLLPGGCQWQEPWKTADNKPRLKGKREKGGQASSVVLSRGGVEDEETMLGARSLGKRSSEFLCFRWWFINYHHPRGPGEPTLKWFRSANEWKSGN